MTQPLVAVVGAKALRHDVNRLCTDESGPLFNAMKRAGYAAVQPVVGLTRARLPVSTRRDARGLLSGTVRASGTKTGGSVWMGRTSVPWAGWVEFGGTRPQGPHDRSARPFVPSGRYLFPAARDDAARAAKAYSDEISKVFASSGVWTNTNADGGSVHD